MCRNDTKILHLQNLLIGGLNKAQKNLNLYFTDSGC